MALAREGQGDGWVAGSVGPYGAMLADGSEYTGAYVGRAWASRELRAFHRPRMELLAEAGADVLACETVPAAAEAEALIAEADALGVPVWLSLTTVVDGDGVVRTRRGERAADVFAMARGRRRGDRRRRQLHRTRGDRARRSPRRRAAGKPVVVYPNSGEGWDAVGRRWTGHARDRDRTTSRPGSTPAPGWSAAAAGSAPQHIAAHRRGRQVPVVRSWHVEVRAVKALSSSQRMGLPPVTATRAPEM